MSFEEDITELITSNDHMTEMVDGKIGAIDARMTAAEAQLQQWLATRHVGFALTDTMIDNNEPYISLEPRFTSLAEAQAFTFSAAEDYAPVDATDDTIKHYADLISNVPGVPGWFSEPGPSQFTGRKSVYANIGVGLLPHPTPKPVNRIALLINSIGSTGTWSHADTTGLLYDQPRTLLYDPQNANREIKGQSWGVTAYNDLFAFHENQPGDFNVGFSTVRVINLGPNPIQIKGFWLIHHCHQKEA